MVSHPSPSFFKTSQSQLSAVTNRNSKGKAAHVLVFPFYQTSYFPLAPGNGFSYVLHVHPTFLQEGAEQQSRAPRNVPVFVRERPDCFQDKLCDLRGGEMLTKGLSERRKGHHAEMHQDFYSFSPQAERAFRDFGADLGKSLHAERQDLFCVIREVY